VPYDEGFQESEPFSQIFRDARLVVVRRVVVLKRIANLFVDHCRVPLFLREQAEQFALETQTRNLSGSRLA